jgi:hypothetical protein
MSKRFIELYSSNRNRALYPQAASFTVPFTNAGQQLGPFNAYDPITTGPIYYSWKGITTGNSLITVGPLKSGSTDGNLLLGQPTTLPLGTTQLSNIYNYYNGLNITISSVSAGTGTQQIVSYNPSTVSITPSVAFDGASGNYTISDPSTSSQIYIPSSDLLGNNILSYSQVYNGYYIVDETLTISTGIIVGRKIVSYNFLTQIATLESPFPSNWDIDDTYTLRKTLPSYSVTAASCTNNTITLSSRASSTDGSYVGQYIYLTPFDPSGTSILSPLPSLTNNVFLVTDYVGSTKTATVISPYGVQLPNGFITCEANIVSFLEDNASSLQYNGSLVSQNESVCYEIALINLSLPNVVLATGGRIAFYPLCYVQLEGVSAAGGQTNFITYSNNPHSSKALFQAAVTDISQPINSTFLKIDSGAQTQTIKFKPNDSLKFSVFLPNGELFQTFQEDTMSPYPPNPAIQINAVFSIKRVA